MLAVMRIIHGKPPIWDLAVSLLGADERTVFTYGSDVYVPGGGELGPELIAHEAVHVAQQTDPVVWWNRYFESPEFRVEQELPAYRAQYADFCKRNKDRNVRARYLVYLAGVMAGPLYARMIDFHSARQFIMGR
jgi:hypothetical protein